MLKDARIIAKKEIKLLFKSTRRIFLLFSTPAIILITVVVVAFFVVVSMPVEAETEVIIINEDTGFSGTNWGEYFYSILLSDNSTSSFSYVNESVSNLETLIDKNDIIIYIPANFSSLINQSYPATFFIYYDDSDIKNDVVVTQITYVSSILNQQLVYIEYGGPINLIRVYATPEGTSKGLGAIIASSFTLIPLYAIFLLVIPPLTLVLISVTIEREQKTLESLLLQPLNRKSIVSGKLLYGMILVAVNTIMNVVTILTIILGTFILLPPELKTQLIPVITTIIENTGFSAWLFAIYLLIGLVLVSILTVSAAVLFSLMAKDEREANMVTSTLIIIPMVSVIFFVFLPISALPEAVQAIIMAIPLLGYLFGVYISVLAGEISIWSWFSLVAQVIWIALSIWFAGRLIESEGVLDISFKNLLRFRRRK
ncbi:MAG: ABC transporter permease [Candidatus Hodarchaeales archaeon]